jgi:hypothetical protein
MLSNTFRALTGLMPRRVLRALLASIEARPDRAAAAGYHVYPRTYTSPLLLKEEVDVVQLSQRRRLPAVNIDENRALRLIETLRPYVPELDDVAVNAVAGEPFWLRNGWYTDFDAASLYALLRHVKPQRYVELGCGFSSYISARALTRNAADGTSSDSLYSDPQPRHDIARFVPSGRVRQARVQDVPLETFTRLDAGDVLFVDTSHVVKCQSDVTHALLTILPLLKPGVWIHIHDVLTPYDYPEEWVTHHWFSNNEQYAVEALLSGGDRYVVELPLFLLWKEHRDALTRFFPRGNVKPHGFWLRKMA